jgi:Icc-related predicted phosphoesterase
MKIQIVSDLHMEFGHIDKLYKEICSAEADVLILAGDISSSDAIVEDINRIQIDSGKRVIFVPGNHEYYRSSRKTLDSEMMTLEDINPNIHVLMERDICIEGICFMGTTGWWDGSNGSIGVNQRQGLNDFRMIYDLCDEGNLDGVVWGRKAKTYLSSRMYWLRHHLPDTKLCVITHHYPHNRSLHPAFTGSPLNACFGNRWEWMFKDYRPELWIHGHTHNSFDYTVDANDGHPHLNSDDKRKSRVVCNPQGYMSEHAVPKGNIVDYYSNHGMELTEADLHIYQTTENTAFEPQKIVEL